MPAIAQLAAVTLDCPDPKALADFYCSVTGWEVMYSDDDYVYIGGEGAVRLGFQRVPEQRPPGWPTPAKQLHLDFSVPDLDQAEAELLQLGAAKPDFQPAAERWRVLLDPAGHPFCISAQAA